MNICPNCGMKGRKIAEANFLIRSIRGLLRRPPVYKCKNCNTRFINEPKSDIIEMK